MARKKPSPSQKILSRLITITCIAVFIYASYNLGAILLDYYQNRKVLHELQEIYYQDTTEVEQDEEQATPREDTHTQIRAGFDQLLAQNPHVVGWITIEDTQIDYPILQADDNEAYMTKNFYGHETRAGSIFLDYRNDITRSDPNYVIYGHRMKDGSMFQHLTKFLEQDFFETHTTFTFDTLYDQYEAEIFAVYQTLTDFNYIQTNFASDEEFEHLIDEIQSRSLYKTDVDVQPGDQILTLSTCDYKLDARDGRLVVHAKLSQP